MIDGSRLRGCCSKLAKRISAISVGVIGHSQDGTEWKIHLQISDEVYKGFFINKSRTICTQVRCPTLFAKVPFGLSSLEVNLIEQGHALQFVLGTVMKAEIGYQRRFSSNKGNPYLAR